MSLFFKIFRPYWRKRRALCREIAALKQDLGLPLRDRARERELARRWNQTQRQCGLSPEVLAPLRRAVVLGSLRLQQRSPAQVTGRDLDTLRQAIDQLDTAFVRQLAAAEQTLACPPCGTTSRLQHRPRQLKPKGSRQQSLRGGSPHSVSKAGRRREQRGPRDTRSGCPPPPSA